MSPSDFDNGQEDVNMMNIPREGNADQLNKSVKLTLSSKKQYDNHLKNVPINSGVNKTPNLNERNQYKGNYGQQINNGIVNINNIYGNDVARNKMNSTMMVQMNNNQAEQLKNQRGNMNKSTLLPNNTGPNMAMNMTQNSRNIQTKMNIMPRNDGSGFISDP